MPAFNAEKTLKKTFADINKKIVKKIILVDDGSKDKTVKTAQKLGIEVYKHPKNLGYGGNQKTCYWEALQYKPQVVVMIHPDYQYDATLIEELIRPILQGRYGYTFGSRIRTRKEALDGGMPLHKYLFNRMYTLFANPVLGVNFSEHMSGMRAYSATTLETVPFQRFSNDFIFDQQFTVSAIAKGIRIGEIPIPVRFYEESSSIKLLPGLKFGINSLAVLLLYILNNLNIYKSNIFK
ncbi:glycosyltransferase family 2 protein [Candidatus Woesebacteria bacterium]|nr:MAG: glycosyltransferase family 2 protein [Candidatus Woesebacteria bacterium]